MRSTLISSTAIALLLTFPAIAFGQETATPAEENSAEVVEYNADTVIATVGDTKITMGHVAAMMVKLPQQYQELPDQTLFDGIVEQLVDQELLSSDLKSKGVISMNIELMLENEMRALLAQENIQQLRNATIPEEAVQAAYDEAFGNLEPEFEYNASHILVETEDEAKALVTELEGGENFAELAKEKSTGPSGPRGGELGWFGAGAMVAEFEAAVTTLDVEEISPPVQTEFGWHVLRLNEKREKAAPTLEETRDNIIADLQQRSVQGRIESLREDVGFTLTLDGIPASAVRNPSLLGR